MEKPKLGILALSSYILFSSVVSSTAHAQSRINNIDDVEYRGTLDYQNAGYSLNFTQSHERTLKKLVERASEVTDIEDKLRLDFRNAIINQVGGIGGEYKRSQLDVNGKYTFKLTGRPDGTVSARVGGVSLNASAAIDLDSIFGDATVSVTTGTIWLTGDYNVVTGKITNLVPNNFNVSTRVDIDWILDWFPFLSNLTIWFEDSFEQDIRSFMVNRVNNFVNTQRDRTFFTLYDAIPDDKFVLGDYDAGDELRKVALRLFTDLVSNESFELIIDRKEIKYNAVSPWNGNVGSPYSTIPAQYDSHEISINLSDHLFLEVRDIPKFRTFYHPSCSWSYCFGIPGGATQPQDLANTPENPTDITIRKSNGEQVVIPYGLSFDFDSLYRLFEANYDPDPVPPTSPFNAGDLVITKGSYGNYLSNHCQWTNTGSNGKILSCGGVSVATERTITNYGTYTQVTLNNSSLFNLQGNYPNYKITAR